MESGRICALNLSCFLGEYQWLLDSYIIEFFTEQHWVKLPSSWREVLSCVELSEAGQLLLNQPIRSRVYPLSFLAFVTTTHTLSLPRRQRTIFDSHHDCGLPAALEECRTLQLSHAVGDQCVLQGGKESLAKQGRKNSEITNPSQIGGLDHMFRLHVKPKKQHEIKLLGEIIFELSQRTKCQNIIDVGSGQGHLARYLAFHYGLRVTAVEAVGCHLKTAAKFDGEVRKEMEKKGRRMADKAASDDQDGLEECGSLRHIETLIHPEATVSEFLEQLGLRHSRSHSSSGSAQSHAETGQVYHHPPLPKKYILVGLHTCGDLAPTMLRVYRQSEQIVGLVSVGCCYMKITCAPDMMLKPEVVDETRGSQGSLHAASINTKVSDRGKVLEVEESAENSISCLPLPSATATKEVQTQGYPLSEYVRSLPGHTLSYVAREVACHSIETYHERLQVESEHLKVHCHRAAVETILRKNGLRRCQVKVSRRVSKLPFEDYAKAILQSVSLPTDLNLQALAPLLAEWKKVAVFFVLRQLVAPCVESLLLLDRALFLMEKGHCVDLMPVFDPKISPRNVVIVAHRYTPSTHTS